MAIKLKCPNSDCGKVLTVGDEMAGQKGKCPACGTAFKIPGGSGGSRPRPRPSGQGSSGQRKRPSGQGSSGQRKRPSSGSSGQQRRSGGSQGGSKGGRSAFAEARGGSSGSQKRRRPAPPPEDEFEDFSVDDEFYEDDDFYEDDFSGGGAFGGGDDLYEDDYGGGYDDYGDGGYDAGYGGGFPSAAPKKSKKKKSGGGGRKHWKMVRIGFLITAIGMCIFAGGVGFLLLGDATGNLGDMTMKSASRLAKKLQKDSSSSKSIESSMKAFEKVAKRAERAEKMYKTGVTFLKVGHIFALIGTIVLVVGYVFFIWAPTSKGAKGLAIALVAVAGTNVVLRLVFVVVPLFGEGWVYNHRSFSTMLGIMATLEGGLSEGIFETGTGTAIASMFFDIGFAAELLLLTLFLASVGMLMKDRQQHRDSQQVMFTLIAYASVMLVLYVFILVQVNSDSAGSEKWLYWVFLLLTWALNAILALTLANMITNLFHGHRTTR